MVINKQVFVLRHAESECNKSKILHGQSIDCGLSELGFKQAENFYHSHSINCFDKIYVSGLRRTFQTVASFIDANIPYEVLEELNEVNWGMIEGKPLQGQTKTIYNNVIRNWKNGDSFAKTPDGETLNDIVLRVEAAIEYILSKNHSRILIVSHSRLIKILLCILLGFELNSMDSFRHGNMALYSLTGISNKFSLVN